MNKKLVSIKFIFFPNMWKYKIITMVGAVCIGVHDFNHPQYCSLNKSEAHTVRRAQPPFCDDYRCYIPAFLV
jgi:hypothetical protein